MMMMKMKINDEDLKTLIKIENYLGMETDQKELCIELINIIDKLQKIKEETK